MLIFVSRKLIHKRELLKYLYCKIFSLVVELVNKADNLCFHWPRRMLVLDCDWLRRDGSVSGQFGLSCWFGGKWEPVCHQPS